MTCLRFLAFSLVSGVQLSEKTPVGMDYYTEEDALAEQGPPESLLEEKTGAEMFEKCCCPTALGPLVPQVICRAKTDGSLRTRVLPPHGVKFAEDNKHLAKFGESLRHVAFTQKTYTSCRHMGGTRHEKFMEYGTGKEYPGNRPAATNALLPSRSIGRTGGTTCFEDVKNISTARSESQVSESYKAIVPGTQQQTGGFLALQRNYARQPERLFKAANYIIYPQPWSDEEKRAIEADVYGGQGYYRKIGSFSDPNFDNPEKLPHMVPASAPPIPLVEHHWVDGCPTGVPKSKKNDKIQCHRTVEQYHAYCPVERNNQPDVYVRDRIIGQKLRKCPAGWQTGPQCKCGV